MYFLDTACIVKLQAGEDVIAKDLFQRKEATEQEIEAVNVVATEFVELFHIQMPIPEAHPGISCPLIFIQLIFSDPPQYTPNIVTFPSRTNGIQNNWVDGQVPSWLQSGLLAKWR